MKKKWIRARSTEQKQERIDQIVSATEKLYNKFDYEDITFVQIAKELDFVRGNLYKYFNSKEEIFLEFLKHDIRHWKTDLLNEYKKSEGYSIKEFAEIWVDILLKNKRLMELISILYLHLEKAASYESLIDFKEVLIVEFGEVINHIVGKIDGFTEDLVGNFINYQAIVGIGIHQTTDLSDTQNKILEEPKFSNFKIDLREHYIQILVYILDGLLARKI